MNPWIWQPLLAAALTLGLIVPGCERHEAPPPPPPAEVATITVQPQRVVLTTELPGRTTAFRVAEIRPQVNGLIQERLFTEGSDVKAKDQLYQIDPAPYKAELNHAEATVDASRKAADRARAALVASLAGIAKQKATVAFARTNKERFENLFADKAVSASQRDQAVTDADIAEATLRAVEAQVESDKQAIAAAEAAIKQAEAALKTANINLAYTAIVAPHSRSHRTVHRDGRRHRYGVSARRVGDHPAVGPHLCGRAPIHESPAAPDASPGGWASGAQREHPERSLAHPGRRHKIPSQGSASVPGHLGGFDHGVRDPADGLPQPERRPPPEHVCPGGHP